MPGNPPQKSLAILHTEASLGWGGQERRILVEALAMRQRGHRPAFVCDPRGELYRRARLQNFPVTPLVFGGIHNLGAWVGLRRLSGRGGVRHFEHPQLPGFLGGDPGLAELAGPAPAGADPASVHPGQGQPAHPVALPDPGGHHHHRAGHQGFARGAPGGAGPPDLFHPHRGGTGGVCPPGKKPGVAGPSADSRRCLHLRQRGGAALLEGPPRSFGGLPCASPGRRPGLSPPGGGGSLPGGDRRENRPTGRAAPGAPGGLSGPGGAVVCPDGREGPGVLRQRRGPPVPPPGPGHGPAGGGHHRGRHSGSDRR